GAVLYELLSGRPPFVGPAGEVLRRVQAEEPPPPRPAGGGVPRGPETVRLQAVAQRPARRHPRAPAPAHDPAPLPRRRPLRPPPPPVPRRLPPPGHARPSGGARRAHGRARPHRTAHTARPRGGRSERGSPPPTRARRLGAG